METHHDQLRVLTIRGKGFCDSDCLFCIEKYSTGHAHAPKVDRVRELILEGSGKYNMLFFASGEPSVNPKLYEYVELARSKGYLHFGMSSHFRTFADPQRAREVLDAGFEFFDISLHAADYEGQLAVNPIGDAGRSLDEALIGLRNVYSLAEKNGKRLGVTHKIVISRLNFDNLYPIFEATYRLGVRSYILQPVKTEGLEPAHVPRLAVTEDEFLPHLNRLLEATETSGARFKLYGMSRLGVYPSKALEVEANVIRHAQGKATPEAPIISANQLISKRADRARGQAHKITMRLPTGERFAFECAADELILNAALSAGLYLPYGCRMASCGMCTARIVEGKVDMTAQDVLTDRQVEEGFVLLCSSTPRSDLTLLSNQEGALGL